MKFPSLNGQPSGLYIHIPFCRQRCHYCHFDIKVLHPQTPRLDWYSRFTHALCGELENHAKAFPGAVIKSVYMGGGTPSQLPTEMLLKIVKTILSSFKLEETEWTLEINPDDVSNHHWDNILNSGINRFSLGVQTFHDPSLQALRRAHRGGEALSALTHLPIPSLGRSFDLMLGLPYQNLTTLNRDLDLLERLQFEHVSVYMLERDLPTAIDKQVDLLADDDVVVDWYEHVCDRLEVMGFEQYEISNFAKPGFQSQHNLNYWNVGNTIAAGPAAHGQIQNVHYGNFPQISDYLKQVEACGTGLQDFENWDKARLKSERIIQGLRKTEGIPAEWFSSLDLDLSDLDELLILKNGRYQLTKKGRLLSNEVFQAFV